MAAGVGLVGLLVLAWGCGDDAPPCSGVLLDNGRCVAADAGRDAAVADAASDVGADAGSGDASIDAASTDAASTDAASTDAASMDASADAASTDACVPTASEETSCDGLDDDCDGIVDEGVLTTFFADADEDGWGDASVVCTECADTDCPGGTAWTTLEGDCDDTHDTVFPVPDPSAPELLCDGLDDDCDGVIDDGLLEAFFRDVDGDGYGDDATRRMACSAPSGFVSEGGDCDDGDDRAFPGQRLFFATPRASGGFDFDCDGVERKELAERGMFDTCDRTACTLGDRWQPAPGASYDCGAPGERCHCLMFGLGCGGPICREEALKCN